MSLPQYSRYKDSGVEWLGFIPEHWHVGRLKNSVLSSKGGIWGNEESFDDNDIACVRVADFDRSKLRVALENPTIRNVLQSERNGRILERGDLLLEKSGGGENQLVGCVVMYEYDEQAVCSNFVARLKLEANMVSEYWCYVHFALYALRINYCSINQTSGIQNLDQDKYLNEIVPYPDFSEQSAIATFLDRETAKIDALISEQEKLITLLSEKRQATISHAVTKGLNPDVPMKDSGVEWLGAVPEHWEVGSIKKWFSTSSGGTPDTGKHDIYYTDDGGFPWIRTTDLNNDVLDAFEISITEEAIKNTACKMLPAGSVLLAMYGGDGTIGKNALLGFDACINQAVCALIPNQAFLSEFTFRYVQFYRPYWMIGAESSRKDPNIGQALIQNTKIPRPPADEQMQIVSFLSTEICRLDALSAEARRGIELLNERRGALISAAVTGKIDVREAAQRDQVTIQEAA